MRKGFDGLALMVRETLRRDPHGGHLFVFRGRRGGLIKVLWRYPGAVNRHHGMVEFRGRMRVSGRSERAEMH